MLTNLPELNEKKRLRVKHKINLKCNFNFDFKFFYVIRNKQFSDAVDLQTSVQYRAEALPTFTAEFDFISYAPRDNKLILSSKDC